MGRDRALEYTCTNVQAWGREGHGGDGWGFPVGSNTEEQLRKKWDKITSHRDAPNSRGSLPLLVPSVA